MSTDNSYLASKLELRRHFLRAYHPPGQRHVLDCCQATGMLWSLLRQEFPLDSYWGLDLVPRKGRIKIDSVRIVAQAGWRAEIVDVDAYGSPWAHWVSILRTASLPITVFLTAGAGGAAGSLRSRLSNFEKKILGVPDAIPMMIGGSLRPLVVPAMLALALERFTVREACEALPSENARYFGIRLDPIPGRQTGGEAGETAPRSKSPRATPAQKPKNA